jgi:hypothetical protein
MANSNKKMAGKAAGSMSKTAGTKAKAGKAAGARPRSVARGK